MNCASSSTATFYHLVLRHLYIKDCCISVLLILINFIASLNTRMLCIIKKTIHKKNAYHCRGNSSNHSIKDKRYTQAGVFILASTMVATRYHKVCINPRYQRKKHNLLYVCKYIQDLANSVTLDHKTALDYFS